MTKQETNKDKNGMKYEIKTNKMREKQNAGG